MKYELDYTDISVDQHMLVEVKVVTRDASPSPILLQTRALTVEQHVHFGSSYYSIHVPLQSRFRWQKDEKRDRIDRAVVIETPIFELRHSGRDVEFYEASVLAYEGPKALLPSDIEEEVLRDAYTSLDGLEGYQLKIIRRYQPQKGEP